jgi:hypothetical protein
MEILARTTEDEMVLAFLRAELGSTRWSGYIHLILNALGKLRDTR